MYSLVLMTAMTASAPEAPNWGWRCRPAACYGCNGCTGCYGGCSGCTGCNGGCAGGSGGASGGSGGFARSGFGGFLSAYGNCLGCWGALATSWGCHGCYGASLGYHGCIGMPAYYERAMGGWGANYTYTHSYPGMPPANVPSSIAPTAPKPAVGPKDDGKGARIIVDVPAHAKLYIDGQLMKTGSEQRQFYTPPLEHGQSYFYDVKVEVMKDGKPVSREKQVFVKAGDVIRESFADLANPTHVAAALK
jgi:uncharacterized protein (TIGR03000 family)